jgi:uncharacterized membrane protein YfcA
MLQKKIMGMLGVWLLVSVIVLQSTKSDITNLIIVGVITTISGLTLTLKKYIESWIGAILGLWLIISAFIPSIQNVPCKYYNVIIIGIIFILIGFVRHKGKIDSINQYKHSSQFH